jgi:hypothetical protein
MEKEKKLYKNVVFDGTVKHIRNVMLHSEAKMTSWMKLEKELGISRKVMLDRLKTAHHWGYKNRCVK